ncbi:subtilisin-like protein [Dacryopinax primogenitus]|uniref:tripeptidyl-peptidase II n=1 Tax=Dacryopinax primogenitus (strain DJM 731) TaxID=1858805 RepID=M5G9F6_DACPD|nr:subtilisin-like protein [Dacryopinax primogenitus]EJU00428.1 subtilisin-like protein [Dacryopinax primogenitus]
MLAGFLLLAVPWAAFALPSPSIAVKRTHERRSVLPHQWEEHSDAHPDMRVPLRIALTQSNLDVAYDELLKVSDPESPDFANHWTAKQIAQFFAPSKETVDTVIAWLEDEGIDRSRVKQTDSLGWLQVANLSVTEAETLLDTKYRIYKHASGAPHLGCGSYSVPEHVSKHIDFITPTVHFDSPVNAHRQEKRKRDVEPGIAKTIGQPRIGTTPKQGASLSVPNIITELEQCGSQITPICLQSLYKMPFDLQLATSKNSYGIVEYTPQSYLATDLDMFFKQFLAKAVGQRPTLDSIDGGEPQTELEGFGYNGESDLDLQYAMALVYPLNPTLFQAGDIVEGASFNNFLDAIDGTYCTYEGGDDPTQDGVYPDPNGGGYEGTENCGTYAPTYVLSTSYAYNEADLTPFYEQRQCSEYAKLGLQGVTVLYSSGDNGVAGNDGQCLTANGTYSASGTRFNPSFPGTCPYITSVGATQIKPNGTVFEAEEACETVIYSGGGFSNVFPMPSYQASAVNSYFEKYPPPYTAAQYNNSRTVRGFPDISANGANYVIAIDGEFDLVYGTSCSSPTVGSVITLVNDARLAAGKKPVGFLNPTLYANPWMLNDITTGGNQGCGTAGFTSVPGWDPVTGLGTPDYGLLVAKYLTLP